MKASVKISELAAALARMKQVVSRKTTLPILGNVLLAAEKRGLTITGTDLDTYLTLDVPADVATAGVVCVPCARLASALGKMDGETVELSGKKAALAGKSATMRFELLGLDPGEFPPCPAIEGGSVQSFGAGVIADAIGRELACCSDDTTRYVLNGIWMGAVDGALTMVATDGRRLAVTALDCEPGALSALVPTDAARLMACLDGGGATELRAGANQIEASGKGWRLVSKLIEGVYPNWKQVMPPDGAAHRFTVDREALIEAVRFAATISPADPTVRLSFEKSGLTVTSACPDIGETAAELNIELTGGAMVAAFNPQFLLDAIGFLTGATITGEIQDGTTPLRLTDGVTVNVLMPKRIG